MCVPEIDSCRDGAANIIKKSVFLMVLIDWSGFVKTIAQSISEIFCRPKTTDKSFLCAFYPDTAHHATRDH